jgi:hypothetical protein
MPVPIVVVTGVESTRVCYDYDDYYEVVVILTLSRRLRFLQQFADHGAILVYMLYFIAWHFDGFGFDIARKQVVNVNAECFLLEH